MRHLKKNHTEKSFWIATGVFLSAMMLFATIAGDGGTWQAPAEDTWLDEEQARSSDWGTYGDAISVAPATPMANYVVRFDIPASFNYGLCKTGGDDIRFFDSANTSLPYWIETWVSGGVSTIWVKVPLAGTTSFTMRYGNVSASPASSGESTFELFDDFSGSSVNVSKWSVYTDSYSTATVSGGQLHLVVDTISDWNGLVIVGFHDTYINSGLPSATIYNNGVRFGGIDNVVTQSATVATSTAHNISSRWFTAETRWINSTRVDFYDDDSLVATHVTNIPTTNLPVRLLTRLCYAGPGTHFGSYVTSQNTTIGRAGKAMRTNFYCTQPLTGAIARSDYNWVFVRSCVADEPVAFIDNQEPTLTNDKVSPTSGNQLTTFNFSVVFTDGDNAPPGLIYMKLNGTSFPLVKSNPSDTTYSDGCQYEVCHYLQPGSYNYSFECVQSAIVSTPTWSNLTVTETNTNVPWLTNTAVTPDAGSNTTIFSFNTFYHDLDNNMPETINVVINGSVFPMVEADPCDSYVVDGKQYVHSTTLDWGYHEYEVQCFDGLYSNTSGIIYSPEVFPFQYSNVTFFSEDFESGNLSKWATVTGLWHVTSTWPKPWADAYPWEPCHSPSNGMWVGSEVSGLYSSSHTAELVSVPIEITDITQSAYLEFFHWQNTESSWDYCRVYVRVNGGSWISLYSYTGSVSPWQRQLYDLSAYCTPGNTLELRFQFTSDTSVEYRGWVVDDIKLFTNGSLSAPVLISPPNGAPVVAGNQAFTWNNIGDVGPFSYEWQLSSTSNFSVVLDSVVGIPETPGSTSVVRDMSSYSGIYYWRARAVAGPIIGAWSSSFTINFTGASSDDDYEENDNYLEAYDISGYNATWLSSISGAGINTDDDYYEIAVPGGNESLYILAMFTHAEGDINIQLLDDSGLYVTGSFGTSDLEIINTTVSLAGIYYIYVYGPDLESTYDLYWQCSPPVVVVDDNYEENDDAGSAYSLVLYEDTWLTSINGTGIYNDDDFYEIAVSSGNESLHVLATFSSMVGGMFLYLFNSTLDLVASEFPTLDQVLLEEILPAGGGTYYVCITGTTPGMTYDLRWWTTVPPLEDLYEENDDPSTAFNLTSYENTWLSSIYGKGRCNDPDYYEIAAASGSEYIEVQLDSGIGMSSISLLDTSYATIVSYQHRILYRVPDGGGTYYLLVSSSTQGCIYDLIWNTTAPPLDDAYEENDNNVTAYDLTSNEGTWLSSIAGTGISLDDDYYRIDVTLANPLIAISINITGDGVMKCQLVDENGTSYLMQDLISNKDSQLRFLLSQAGTYYLRLYSSVAGCTYDVRWTGSAVPVDDTYEENDHPMVATNLAAHAGQWLSGINGTAVLLDDDFYQVEVPSGHGFLDVAVNFTQAYGAEIYLLLFDASFNNIGYGIRPAGPGGVNYGVNCTPGFYFVYVYAGSFYPASGLSYDLKYETSPLPVDDNYEINDDPPTAYDLNVHEGTWLSSINGTGLLYNIRGTPMVYDYFKIQVGPGPERVDVQLLTNETRAPVMLAILNSGGSPVMYMAMEDLMKSNITITSVLFPGTYFIIVFTYEPIGQEYDLKWEGSPPTTIPDVPVLVTPANGSTIPTNWAFLSAMVSDPDGDRLDVYFFNATDDSLLGVDYGVESGGLAELTLPPSSVADGVLNAWYVVVMDDYMYQASGVATFTYMSANDPPSVPVLVAPLNGSVVTGTSQVLTVQVSDPDLSSLDVYFVNASDGTPFALVLGVTSGENVSVTWSGLVEGNTHAWYVIVYDGAAMIGTGNFTFTVYSGPTYPNEPALVAPGSGGRVAGGDQALEVFVSHVGAKPMNVTFYNATDDSIIGTDLNVASGSIASVTWPSLPNGITCSWYAIADDGTAQNQSATWIFDTNVLPAGVLSSPSNGSRLSYALYYFIGTTLDINVTDADGDVMDVYFFNATDAALIDFTTGVVSGTTASVPAPATMNAGDGLAWYAIIDDGYELVMVGWWYFTLNTPAMSTLAAFPANGSRIADQVVVLSIDVIDLDGDMLDVSFYNASDGSLVGTDVGVTSGTDATILWGSLVQGQVYGWYVLIDDGFDTTLFGYFWFGVNRPPNPASDRAPSNGAFLVHLSPYLLARATDPDGDVLNVTFFNAADDSIIGTALNIANGSFAIIQWFGLNLSTTYGWYVQVSDGLNATNSSTWTFSTVDDDACEENDDRISAYDLSSYEGVNLQGVIGGQGVQADEDWYMITVSPGYLYIEIDLSFVSMLGDIDMDLVNDTGGLVVRSNLASANGELIQHILPAPGIYYIRIYDSNNGNMYDFYWTTSWNAAFPSPPALVTPTDGARITESSIVLEVNATHPDSFPMNVTFHNASDNSIIGVAYNVASDSIASTTWTSLLIGQTSRWYAVADDGHNQVQSTTWSVHVNAAPNPAFDPNPWNATLVGGTSPWLVVTVTDPDGDVLNATFFNADDDSVIGISTNIANGSFAFAQWSGLSLGTEYGWYVVVSDGLNASVSPTWTFTTLSDDWYEENDDRLSAHDLSASEATWLSAVHGLGIQGDDDWYEITVLPNNLSLVVYALFTHSGGDIDVQLVNATGAVINSSVSVTDNESILHLLDAPGTYYIRVYYSDVGNVYDLYWETAWSAPAPNSPSLVSPSNGARVSEAGTVLEVTATHPASVPMSVTFYNASDASIIGFQLNVPSGSVASTTWGNLPNGQTCSWYAIADDGHNQNQSLTWTINVNALPGAVLFSPPNGSVQPALSPVTIAVTVSDPESDAMDAYFYNATDNSFIGSELAVPSGGIANTDCPLVPSGDAFWWYVVLDDGYSTRMIGNWTFTANNVPGNGSYVYPENGSAIISTDALLMLEVIDLDGDSMDVEFRDASTGSLIYTDSSVANGSNAFGFWNSLTMGSTYTWYAIIDDGVDAYTTVNFTFRINTPPVPPFNPVPANMSIDVVLDPMLAVNVSDADGDLLSVGFYNASDGSVIDYISGVSSGSVVTTLWSGLPRGTVQTWHASVFDGTTMVNSSVWSFTTTSDDAYEENDDLVSAYNLTTIQGTWLSGISGLGIQSDEDWYEIIILPGYEHVMINLTFTHAEGDINVELLDHEGSWQGASGSTDDDECIDTTVFTPGTYYIRVYYDDAGNAYDLQWMTFPVSGKPYIVGDPSPANGSMVPVTDVELSVHVADPEGDPMDVYFVGLLGAGNYTFIANMSGVANDTVVNATWAGRVRGLTYTWTVMITDGFTIFYGPNFTFSVLHTEEPYVIGSPAPANGSVFTQTSVLLSVRVADAENATLEVLFAGAEIGMPASAIGVPVVVSNNSFATAAWLFLSVSTTYVWFYIIHDGDNYVSGENRTFRVEPSLAPYVVGTPAPANDSIVYGTSVLLSIHVADPEGDLLTVLFGGGEEGTGISTLVNNMGVLNDTVVTFLWENLTAYTYYEWSYAIEDGYNTVWGLVYKFFVIPSELPYIIGTPAPANGSVATTSQVLLQVRVGDPDSTLLTVHFAEVIGFMLYQPIATVPNVANGSIASAAWTINQSNVVHVWAVIIFDGYVYHYSPNFTLSINLPSAQSLAVSPPNGTVITGTAMQLSILASDPDSTTLNVMFYNAANSAVIGSVVNVANGTIVNVTWGSLAKGSSYTWHAVVSDGHSTLQTETWSFRINQVPGMPSLVVPVDGVVLTGTSVQLAVDVTDADGDTLEVFFYNADGDVLIGHVASVSSGGRATITWNNLTAGTSYAWYVVVSDGRENTNSTAWGFLMRAPGFNLVEFLEENLLLVVIIGAGLVGIIAVGAVASRRKAKAKSAPVKKGKGDVASKQPKKSPGVYDPDALVPVPRIAPAKPSSGPVPKAPVVVTRPNVMCTQCSQQFTVQNLTDETVVQCPTCRVSMSMLFYCPACKNPLVLSKEMVLATRGKQIQCSHCYTSFVL